MTVYRNIPHDPPEVPTDSNPACRILTPSGYSIAVLANESRKKQKTLFQPKPPKKHFDLMSNFGEELTHLTLKKKTKQNTHFTYLHLEFCWCEFCCSAGCDPKSFDLLKFSDSERQMDQKLGSLYIPSGKRSHSWLEYPHFQ